MTNRGIAHVVRYERGRLAAISIVRHGVARACVACVVCHPFLPALVAVTG